MLQTYLNRIHDVAQQRGVRKNYFHWSLGNLIRDYAEDMGLEDVRITVLAETRHRDDNMTAHTAIAGDLSNGSSAADLRIEDGGGDPIGYVRTIAPGADLDDFEPGGRRDDVAAGGSTNNSAPGDEETARRSGPSNLLLTNFYGFRLYWKGELKEALTIDPPAADADEGARASVEEKAAAGRLVGAFLRPA